MNKILFFSLFFFFACSEKSMVKIESGILSYSDTLTFSLVSLGPEYNSLEVSVEHDQEFAFQNLYVELGIGTHNLPTTYKNYSIQLSSSEGYWLGQCKKGRCSTHSLIDLPGHFESGDTLYVSIVQASREKVLNGIYSLGINWP